MRRDSKEVISGKGFLKTLDGNCGKFLKILGWMDFLRDDGDQIVLTDKGTYWLHALKDILAIDYVSNSKATGLCLEAL